MGLLDGFKKLLGEAGQVAQGVERQLNPFDGGATYNNPRPQQRVQPPRGSGGVALPGAPITNTPIPSPMGQRYLANPYSTEFVGPNAVDPMIFGYGADNSVRTEFPPYRTESPIPSIPGNRYARNPYSSEFIGVDPMVFGYGPDNTRYR